MVGMNLFGESSTDSFNSGEVSSTVSRLDDGAIENVPAFVAENTVPQTPDAIQPAPAINTAEVTQQTEAPIVQNVAVQAFTPTINSVAVETTPTIPNTQQPSQPVETPKEAPFGMIDTIMIPGSTPPSTTATPGEIQTPNPTAAAGFVMNPTPTPSPAAAPVATPVVPPVAETPVETQGVIMNQMPVAIPQQAPPVQQPTEAPAPKVVEDTNFESLGTIIAVNDNTITLRLAKDILTLPNLVNTHVVFVFENEKIVGEVTDTETNNIKINVVGQISGDRFITGLNRKPDYNSKIRVVN